MLRFFVSFSILKTGLGQTTSISGEWNRGLGRCWPNVCNVLISEIHAGYLAWFPFKVVMVSNYHCIYGLQLLCVWETSQGSSEMEEPVAVGPVSVMCIQRSQLNSVQQCFRVG